MSGARCPRCGREATEASAFCTGCGAPLRLPDDAPARRLDVTVDLDRRHRDGALAPVERSQWDLGPLAAAALAEPAPACAPANVAVPAPHIRTPLPGPAPLARAAGAPGEPHVAVDPDLDLPEADVDALEVHVERAEPWRRVVAWVVDGVPFVAGGVALGFSVLREAAAGRGSPAAIEDVLDLLARERVIAFSIAAAVALALATYATLAHALGGATLGKRLVGIRVVGPDGAPPSPARSAIRSFLAVLSAAFLGLGFLLALFTRTGRALHDLLARTWVVKAP
jgi:resuscitation-promoting factor RpfA